MRISDWSSDVCSSDLAVGRRLRHPNIARNHGLIHAVAEIAADVGSDHFAEIVAPVEHGEHHALKRQVLVQAAAHPVDGAHEMAETLKGIELRLQRHQHSVGPDKGVQRSEEHTSELQSLMRISYAVFCLTKKTTHLVYIMKD